MTYRWLAASPSGINSSHKLHAALANMLTVDSPKTRPVRLAPPYRFTRDDYHAMAAAGILGEDDRVEIIAGEIITQMPIGTAHSSVVGRLTMLLASRVANRAIVWVQNPIALNAFSEPEPDVALLRPRSDYYVDSHPAPEDVILLIEVADTSLAFHREEKIPLYAEAGIAARHERSRLVVGSEGNPPRALQSEGIQRTHYFPNSRNPNRAG